MRIKWYTLFRKRRIMRTAPAVYILLNLFVDIQSHGIKLHRSRDSLKRAKQNGTIGIHAFATNPAIPAPRLSPNKLRARRSAGEASRNQSCRPSSSEASPVRHIGSRKFREAPEPAHGNRRRRRDGGGLAPSAPLEAYTHTCIPALTKGNKSAEKSARD